MAGKDRKTSREAAKEGAQILPFRREATLRFGLVVFLFIFLYLVFSLVRYATRETYSTFTVGQVSSLSDSRSYRAILLRQENVVSSRWAGYVDVFAQEGNRVSVGSVVSSVDEIGTYSAEIREAAGSQSLTDADLLNLKGRLSRLAASYNGENFRSVYETKNAIHSFFLSNIGSLSLAALEQNNTLNEFFHVQTTDVSGLILYYRDGYETKQTGELTAADFEGETYSRAVTEDLVQSGDFLYKIVDSENWSLAVPLSAAEAARFTGLDTIRFTFLKNGLEASASASLINGADGSLILKLDLSRYMIQFASDRFAEIRIESTGKAGYKIPASCLVKESAYLIPAAYAIDGGSEGIFFLEQVMIGQIESSQRAEATIYYHDDEWYYVSRDSLAAETVLIKPDSQDRYTVRLTGEIDGVYDVGSGYAVFRPVRILEENGEYLLVEKGTSGGITSYDVLLLNGAKYTAGQILQ